MKRMSTDQRDRHVRCSELRHGRAQTSKRKRINQRKASDCQAADLQRVRLTAPRLFCLHNSHAHRQMTKFLRKLRENAVQHRRSVLIDFSHTQQLFSCGTLLFLAELDRIRRFARRHGHISCTKPRNDKVHQVLQKLGLLESLGMRHKVKIRDRDVIHWRYDTGTSTDGPLLGQALEDYGGALQARTRELLYRGGIEAIGNVAHHAYQGDRRDGTQIPNGNRWWMLWEIVDEQLVVVFCDLGIGIPRSLPAKHDGSWLSRLLSTLQLRHDDVGLVEAAMNLGASRTASPERGNGLPSMLDVAKQHARSSLYIYSNRGCYSFRNPGERVERISYPDSIMGTLVQWHVPISPPGGAT